MRAVIQRVTQGRCEVDGQVTGQIGRGLVVLLGVGPNDTADTARQLAARMVRLRLFSDDAGRMNRSVQEVGGSVLSISQFTLYADTRRGNRPGFSGAGAPELARELYGVFNAALEQLGLDVQRGVFGADMQISLTNDGPVTLLLDTEGAT
ncbi:D-aminoacyl-tRNA deacylase [Deinococcus sonorensis]|uniref:D-aminoacyl-tRNA deacylase n=2 Tax=Deinococcus sonorensis TaxID=309891 RepID=A0AAU7UAY3_9DEIO